MAILTWRCHICYKERPEDKISVFKKKLVINKISVGDQNIRYCNDNPKCIEGAEKFSHIQEK